MPVRDDMVQGHGSVHGGIVFTLGDSAFAFCCNGTDQVVVGASADVTWVAPARVGDVLIADGEQEVVYGRNGVTRVRITRERDGVLVALFQGRSRNVTRSHP
jgi:acyl-CoA thioesterase